MSLSDEPAAAQRQVRLQVENLCRRFGDRQVVNDLSFEVGAGEIFGLLGPNGAGKSTTMMMITGLLAADSGSVFLNGTQVTADAIAVRQQLGFVPQDLAIYGELTAEENLRFFGRLYRIPAEELGGRVLEALEFVGLADRRGDEAGTFSGGMKRRLNFAAAILHRPALLVLDEPTVGVDPQSRSHLLECIRRLQEAGTSVIYASHYMEEVQAICSRAAIVDHGRMLVCGTVPELLSAIPAEIRVHIKGGPVDGLLNECRLLGQIQQGDMIYTLTLSRGESAADLNNELRHLLAVAHAEQREVVSIRTLEPNLERLFLSLTGTSLRD